jgi:hypothetical protein
MGAWSEGTRPERYPSEFPELGAQVRSLSGDNSDPALPAPPRELP